MTPPKKDTPTSVFHSPSQLLSEEANNKIFSLLEPKTQALSTAIVCAVISRPPKHPEWKTFRTGVAVLVKDHGRRAYSVQIFDIVDWEKVREEELGKGTAYQVSMPNFHQMETAKGQAMGLKFSCEIEARVFAQIARSITMTGQYKTDSCPAPVYIYKENMQEDLQERHETQDSKNRTEHPITPPEPPLLVIRDQSHPRPPRIASIYRNAPMAPPPPPPPANKRFMVTPPSTTVGQDVLQLMQPPQPPLVNKSTALSPPSTPVSRNPPATFFGPPSPTEPGMIMSPAVSLHPTVATDKRLSKSKRITKDMIGSPTNFQHVSHVGFDLEFSLDEKALQAAVGEAVRRPSPARPPPPPPPLPPADCRNSSQPSPSEKNVCFVESNSATLDRQSIVQGKAATCGESGVAKPGLLPDEIEGLSNMRDSLGAELEMMTAKSITNFESVPRINTPSGELMEELLDYIHGMPFDTHGQMVKNSSHCDNKRDFKETNNSGGGLDTSVSDSELKETSNHTLGTNSEIPPALPETLTSTINDTFTSNYSSGKITVHQTGEAEQESFKTLNHKDFQNIIKPTSQDISKDSRLDTSTKVSSEIMNNSNEQKEKSVKITDIPVEIQSFQTIPEILITKDSTNYYFEDNETEKRDCNDDDDANQTPSSSLLESVAPSYTHVTSDTPLELDAPSSTQVASESSLESVATSSTQVASDSSLESVAPSSTQVASDPSLESVAPSSTQVASDPRIETQINTLDSSEQKTTLLSDSNKVDYPTINDNPDPPQKPKRHRRKISRKQISPSPSPPPSVTEL